MVFLSFNFNFLYPFGGTDRASCGWGLSRRADGPYWYIGMSWPNGHGIGLHTRRARDAPLRIAAHTWATKPGARPPSLSPTDALATAKAAKDGSTARTVQRVLVAPRS
jgi:hypothetical protein